MRIALLCAPSLDDFQRRVVETLLTDSQLEVAACAIDVRPQPGVRAKLVRNLRQGRGGFVLVLAARLVTARLRPGHNAGEATEALMHERGVPTIEIDDPRSPHAVGALADLAPEALVLIAGFGIIREPLLNLAPHGVLSYHHGDMRRYRGMPPAFWELYNGERELGVTVQRLSPGLDDGSPIVERSFAIGPRDTLAQVERRIYDGSVEMMREALRAVGAGARPERLPSYGRVYTLPNLRQWLRFQLLMMRRQAWPS